MTQNNHPVNPDKFTQVYCFFSLKQRIEYKKKLAITKKVLKSKKNLQSEQNSACHLEN